MESKGSKFFKKGIAFLIAPAIFSSFLPKIGVLVPQVVRVHLKPLHGKELFLKSVQKLQLFWKIIGESC